MKREDYLAELAAGLDAAEARGGRPVDPGLRREVLAEMEGHIADVAARNPGLSDEEVVASLTLPDLLAEGLYEELVAELPGRGAGAEGVAGAERPGRGGPGPASASASPSSSGAASASSASSSGSARGETGAADRSDWASGWGEGPASEAPSGFSRRLRRFAGGSRLASFEWEGSLDASGIEELWLDFPVADLELASGSSSSIELGCEVEGEDLEAWSPSFVRDGKALLLRDSDEAQIRRLVIAFPPSILRLSVETKSGDLEIDAGDRDCRIRNGSGDVELARAARVHVETASGDVEIGGCLAAAIVTGSGDVCVGEVSDSLSVRTGSGDVEAGLVAGALRVETGSGDIGVRVGAGPLEVTTSSGSVDLDAGPRLEGGKVLSSSGDIEVRLRSSSLDIKAESVSGDLDLDGETGGESVPRRARRRTGKGEGELVLRSLSGDVSVQVD